MGDTVRLPNGKTMTRSRAAALGLLDEAGDPRTDLPITAAEEKAIEREKRAAEWRRSQGLVGPTTTPDGVIVAQRKPEPLRPRNVGPNGETVILKEVVDPETKDVIQVPVDAPTPSPDGPVTEPADLSVPGPDDDLAADAQAAAEDDDEDRVIPDSGLLAALADLPFGDNHPSIQDDLGGADGPGDD